MTWRAVVQSDPADFFRDQVRILLVNDGEEGRCVALPATVEMGEPIPRLEAVTIEPPQPFMVLPTGAASALFEALARHFIGTSDIERLRRELLAERTRVDKLIAGIGRLGGVTA